MRTLNVAIAVLALSACGGGMGSMSENTVTEYQQLTADVKTSATTYGSSMKGATSVSDCQSIHRRYDQEVRPWIGRMMTMSGAMDDYMRGHGGSSVADVSCVSTTMMGELDHHDAAACTSTDPATNLAEVTRHVNAMTSYTGHLWDRCDQMMGTIEGAPAAWGGMMNGCQWSSPSGGMMGNGRMMR